MPSNPDLAQVDHFSTAARTLKGLVGGQVLFSRYVLEKILGRGGMGVVWLARDERLDRLVALKVLPDEVYYDPSAREDLKHETRKSLELTHPNIVRIHDFVEEEGTAAISMEYVDGLTLSELRLREKNKILEADVLGPWIREVCEALHYAHHSAKLVHRDLKPANVMVNSRNQSKVTDFGIACSLHNSLSRVSIRQNTSGTIVYMSPEQMMGEQPSPLDDIYALGSTIYEVMTSKPPFYEGDIARQVRKSEAVSMKERRIALKILGKPIPQNWEAAIAKCLSKERADRPQNSMILAEMLGLVEHPSWSIQKSPKKQPLAARVESLTSRVMALFLGTKHARIATLISALILAMAGGAIPGLLYSLKNSPLSPSARPVPTSPIATLSVPEEKKNPDLSLPPAPVPTAAPVFIPATTDAATAAEDQQALARMNATGHLEIVSTPAGMHYKLFAGGLDAAKSPDAKPLREGTTPDNLNNLDGGALTVVCSREGWEDQIREVQIDGGDNRVEAAFPSGTFTITSTPPGAQVSLDDQLVGVTPFTGETSPGVHNIIATLGTKPEQSKQISIAEGEAATLDFKFVTSRSAVKRKPTPPPSGWQKLQNTLKKVLNIQTSGKNPPKKN